MVGEKASYVEDKPRRYPIELGRASLETDTFEIEIPHDYKVDDLPSPVHVDVGFASYQSKIEIDGSRLRYRREYVVRGLTVSPDRMADWRRLQGVIAADESAPVVLERNP